MIYTLSKLLITSLLIVAITEISKRSSFIGALLASLPLISYKKTNQTLKALIAFDEIIMTDYLLDYVDSKEVRQGVQSSLNRGESYHQLSSTIAKVSGGRMLNGKNEIELDINAESIRLIANTLIFL